MTMRKALMKAEGVPGRCELERLKREHSGFQALKGCVFPFLNEVRQSRIPPHLSQPCTAASVRNKHHSGMCWTWLSHNPSEKPWFTVFIPAEVDLGVNFLFLSKKKSTQKCVFYGGSSDPPLQFPVISEITFSNNSFPFVKTSTHWDEYTGYAGQSMG